MAYGHFKKFDYTNRRKNQTVQIRTLVHSAVEKQDCEFEWISATKLKVVIYWPEFFVFPEQMVNCSADENGNPLYGFDHPLTEDYAERNAEKMDENRRIHDAGYITFSQPMKTDIEDLEFELLEIDIPARAKKVNMLQIEARYVFFLALVHLQHSFDYGNPLINLSFAVLPLLQRKN
jgi:hypothetical protein